MTTGYVWKDIFAWHQTGDGGAFLPARGLIQPGQLHAENAETKRRIHNLLEVSGILDGLHSIRDIAAATDEEILAVHDAAYIDRIKAQSAENGGDAGELTPFGPGGYEIAALSAGGCLTAGRAVMRGEIDNAYVLNRPPGHHAEPDRGCGFCLLANGPIAVEALRREFGIGRVAFVDWDVHHGNGAQRIYYNDPTTLTISMHQHHYYPADTGAVDENGSGAGEGYNLNIPLHPGSGHGAYMHAFETVVIPALDRFRPELIVVLSGFDGGALDPLGRNMAYSTTFREMTRQVKSAAERHCQGRLLVLHEGGYSAAYAPFCGAAVVEELMGATDVIEDPFIPILEGIGMMDLQPHQAEAIARSAALVSRIDAP